MAGKKQQHCDYQHGQPVRMDKPTDPPPPGRPGPRAVPSEVRESYSKAMPPEVKDSYRKGGRS